MKPMNNKQPKMNKNVK